MVDDSQVIRAVLAETLRSLGFAVRQAGEALRCLKDGPPPDLIVADHNLPGRTGLILVAAVRARPD